MGDERWEYRAWYGTSTSRAALLMQRLGENPRTSFATDSYFLTGLPGLTVRVREGTRLEVRRALEKRDEVLLWRYDVAEDFPVHDKIVRRYFAHARRGAGLDAERFHGVADRGRGVIDVDVVKHRRLYDLRDGVTGEVTSVNALGRNATVVGARGADHAAVLRAVRALGLSTKRNLPFEDAVSAWNRRRVARPRRRDRERAGAA